MTTGTLTGWKPGALVLAWPNADHPPFLAKIVGQAWDGARLVAYLYTGRGYFWATQDVISSAGPVLDAMARGQKIEWGHC